MAASGSDGRMKIGLVLPQWTKGMDRQTPGWNDMLQLAQRAEKIGFDSLWLVDHLLIDRAEVMRQHNHEVPEKLAQSEPLGVWECWTLFGALAAVTERVELGPLVSCTGYRNPALLAKMAETIDEISGGRLILGIGAGDYRHEHQIFGYPWDHRVSRFEEAIQIIHDLIKTGSSQFSGEYYSADGCILKPRGPRPGGMPIMIGTPAGGPRMRRLTAHYADIWNGWLAFGRSHPEESARLLENVDRACAENDREPSTLKRSLTIGAGVLGKTIPGAAPIMGTPQEMADTIKIFAEQGFSHLQVYIAPGTLEGVDAFGEVLDRVHS